MRLALMTWACPSWTVERIVEAAKRYGYGGVESRLSVNPAHGAEIVRETHLQRQRLDSYLPLQRWQVLIGG
jgi:hypothetical protein